MSDSEYFRFIYQTELTKPARASLRPTSPRPRRPVSASSCEHHHISIPTGRGFGTASRPCSARSDKSEKTYNFSVKQFNHFCWPDEVRLVGDRAEFVWVLNVTARLRQGVDVTALNVKCFHKRRGSNTVTARRGNVKYFYMHFCTVRFS